MIKGEIMKKFWVKVLACLLMATALLSGCKTLEPETITVRPEIELIEGVTYSNEIGEFDASSNTESIEIYNKNLFYRNGLMPYNADPGVFYCNDETDKENFGTYFCFGTNGANSYSCLYSKDCVSWKWKYGSYIWPADGWEGSMPFAPEIMWDKDANPSDYGIDDDGVGTGAYFMFYTAGQAGRYNYEEGRTGTQTTVGLAVSASPYGPYTMWNGVELGATIGGVNYAEAENFAKYTEYANEDLSNVPNHGRKDGVVTNDDHWFNFAAARASLTFQWENKEFAGQVVDGTLVNEAAKYMVTDEGYLSFGCLDAHPFVDPVTGDKYFYVAHRSSKFIPNEIDGASLFPGFSTYVIKTLDNDWAQLDYSTITRATRPFYNFVSAEAAVAYNEDASAFDPTPFKDGFKETATHEMKEVFIDIDGNDIAMNEGPFMYYNEDTGLYYLTVSSGSYPSNTYHVIQLVGYSPVGPFRKLDADEGGMVLGVQVGKVNELITGVVPEDQLEMKIASKPGLDLRLGTSIGYEFNERIGVQGYFRVNVWNLKVYRKDPIIAIDPLDDITQVTTKVTVNSGYPIANANHVPLEFGVKLYYAFPLGGGKASDASAE
jgi:hypothetical protein